MVFFSPNKILLFWVMLFLSCFYHISYQLMQIFLSSFYSFQICSKVGFFLDVLSWRGICPQLSLYSPTVLSCVPDEYHGDLWALHNGKDFVLGLASFCWQKVIVISKLLIPLSTWANVVEQEYDRQESLHLKARVSKKEPPSLKA